MNVSSPYAPYADQAANAFGIPTQIFQSLIQTESSWNPQAISSAGAIGLTQLMPGTAAGIGVDPHDPLQNVAGGAKYLSTQYTKFGNWSDALAAYNGGPGNVSGSAEQAYAAKVLQGAAALGYAPTASTGAAASASSPAGTAAAPGWFSLQNFLGLGAVDFSHIAIYGIAVGGLLVVGYFGIRALFGSVGIELPKASDAAKIAAL
jgi:hypothetical protein